MSYQFLLHNPSPDLTFVGVVDTVTRKGVVHYKGSLGAFASGGEGCLTITLKRATFKEPFKCIERIKSVAQEIVSTGSLDDWFRQQRES